MIFASTQQIARHCRCLIKWKHDSINLGRMRIIESYQNQAKVVITASVNTHQWRLSLKTHESGKNQKLLGENFQ
jgi:hypothetical protein